MLRKLSVAAMAAIILLCGCSPIRVTERNIFVMDTAISLRLWGDNSDEAIDEIIEKLSDFDRDFSHTRKDGELFSINNREQPSIELSKEMKSILTAAKELSEKTRGAFDPTIAPAIELWGIGTEKNRVPGKPELQAAAQKTNYRKIELSDNQLTLPPGFTINLGAIAKGYASDIARDILNSFDIPRAVLSLGGNIYVKGTRPDGTPWQVGVRDPDGGENDYIAIVRATDKFLISSGDYERFFEADGKRYHHILNPETVSPVENSLRSVVIVSDNGTHGDVYSTALYVMGYEAALGFWRAHNDFEVIFVFDDYRMVITEGLSDSFELCDDSGRYTYETAQR